MNKKILAFALLFTSSLAIAAQHLSFVVNYPYDSNKPNKIVYFYGDNSHKEFTFNVSQIRSSLAEEHTHVGKPCDKLTVDCNGQIFTIEPGQSNTCKLSPGQGGSIYDNNFINGTEGTAITNP